MLITIINSSHDTVSWQDHILKTTSGYYILADTCENSDFIISDHLPLCFTVSIDNLHITAPLSNITSHDRLSYNQCGVSDIDLYKYYPCTRAEHARITLPKSYQYVFCTQHDRDILICTTIQYLTACNVMLNSV